MTTPDQHTEATHSPAVVTPPIAETEERNERFVLTARDADSSGGRSGSTAAQGPSGAATQSATANHQSAMSAGDEPTLSETPTGRALFADDELAGLRARWNSVQAGFVDDPRDCVHKADGLVSDVVEQLTTGFTEARSRLEDRWTRGEEASTEDLRVALKQYRDFFERLLAV